MLQGPWHSPPPPIFHEVSATAKELTYILYVWLKTIWFAVSVHRAQLRATLI